MADVKPIRIVPLHGDALAAPVVAPSLTYRGGALLPAVQVFTIFWGDAWQLDPQSGLIPQVNQFFDFVLTSPLIDQLAEYSVEGTSIGYGSRTGTVVLTGGPPATITDGDIQGLIQQELSTDSMVPQPTPNTLYFVFLPPGVTVTLDGAASCSRFCGYHSEISRQIFYAVMPYPDCTGCTSVLPVLDALTATGSHELCEAITDPIPGQGWYDDQNGEIGDICSWQTKSLGPHKVQLEWSNQAGRCI